MSVQAPALAAVHLDLSMLVTALWHEIDHGSGARASSYFTADADLAFSRHTVRGRDQIDRVYRDRAARGPRVSRHLMANLHVLRREADLAEAVSGLVLYAQDGHPPVPTTTPVLVADVFDRFIRTGEQDGPGHRWLIASRRIENRFLVPGDVLAVPTE